MILLKLRTYIIINLVLLNTNLYSQSRWEFVNPYPTGFSLWDIYCININKIWVVGDKSTILTTEDHGITWNKKLIDSNSHFGSITINNDKIWIVGTNGKILFSSDEGQNWLEKQSYTPKTLHKIQFIDENHGWILAADSLILHTTDQGNTWNKHEISSQYPLNDFFFTSPEKGWVTAGIHYPGNLGIDPFSAGELHMSINGGETWTKVDSSGAKYSGIFFINEDIGWLSINDINSNWNILKTDDGGQKWKNYGEYTWPWRNLYFIDEKKGWGTYYTHIGRTLDGGKSWITSENMDPVDLGQGFTNLFVLDSLKIFSTGSQGYIIESENGGKTWHHLDKRLDIFYGALQGVTFIDENEGWIYGEQWISDPSTDTCLVLHTINGGKTWEKQYPPLNVRFNKIITIDRLNLWAISDEHAYFSVDGGESWNNANVGQADWIFRDIYFKNKLDSSY